MCRFKSVQERFSMSKISDCNSCNVLRSSIFFWFSSLHQTRMVGDISTLHSAWSGRQNSSLYSNLIHTTEWFSLFQLSSFKTNISHSYMRYLEQLIWFISHTTRNRLWWHYLLFNLLLSHFYGMYYIFYFIGVLLLVIYLDSRISPAILQSITL